MTQILDQKPNRNLKEPKIPVLKDQTPPINQIKTHSIHGDLDNNNTKTIDKMPLHPHTPFFLTFVSAPMDTEILETDSAMLVNPYPVPPTPVPSEEIDHTVQQNDLTPTSSSQGRTII